jgi:hypothetical protein
VAGWGCQRHWGPLFRVAAHLMADECTVDSQSPAHSPPVRILWTRVRSRSRLPYLPHSPLPCCALPADCAGLPRSQRVDATTMSSFGTPLAPSGPPPRPSRELWGSLIKCPCAYHGGGRRRPRAGPDPDALPLPLQVVCIMVEQARLPDAPPTPLPSPPMFGLTQLERHSSVVCVVMDSLRGTTPPPSASRHAATPSHAVVLTCRSLWLAFALVAFFVLHRPIVAQSSVTDRVHPQVRCGVA